jgi:hypothetical protein
MRTIITLAVLVLAIAAPTREATAATDGVITKPQAAGAAPPARQDPPVRPLAWPLRASVMRQCEKAFPDEGICACVVHEVEVLSPDAQVVTAEALQLAVKRCRNL